jgi:hypothetical protein
VNNAATYLLYESGQGAFEMAYKAFMDSIRDDGRSPVTPEMAFNTVKIVEEVCAQL